MTGSTIRASVTEPSTATVRSPHRRMSPPLFGIILLCFLLPFVTVNCGEAVTFTGLHAATGIDRPDEQADHAAPNVWALVAFSSAGVGLLLGLLRGRTGALGGALAGFAGIVGLDGFITYVTIETSGNFVVRIGYLLSLFLFLGAIALNDHLLTRPRTPAAGVPAVWTSKRLFSGAMILVAALLLTTLLGTVGERQSDVGYYEMGGSFLFFLSGVVLATATGLVGLIHAFVYRGRSGYE